MGGASGDCDATIIVVAWNVAPYVEQAVKSCLAQTLASIEVIVIENASDDGTRAIIERAIAGHANARMIANTSNLGLGIGRNLGLAHARGDYIAFLDGDDWLEPDAIEKALKAARTHNADVVVFDHSRHHESGRVQRGHNRRFLRGGLCETMESRFTVVQSFSSAWNKLYRRSFLEAEGFKFSDTFYEDLDWSFPIIMVAPRVASVAEPLINYRLRRGSILRSPSPRHFEVFARWRAVLDFMKKNAHRIDPRWRPVIADQLASQNEAMLRSPLRGTLAQRVEFAAKAKVLFREIDPGCSLQLNPARRLRYVATWRGWSRLALALTLATTLPKR